ncbi:PRD domain-containing protein [Lactobacillus gigeriorum]|uniref:PRD domain-containing protein n=1 Tax=Lactobacillus gigeriorum TaxID=1203069 RepID=UPI000309A208|nr:PRD domain-containing protein [Lactobacillus gigeriorum]
MLSKNAKDLLEKIHDSSLYLKVISFVQGLIDKNQLEPTEIQEKVLVNHLIEMVGRAKNGTALEEVDPVIFSNVSNSSLELADKVVKYIEKNIGKLSESEKYVLSIHFENMIIN